MENSEKPMLDDMAVFARVVEHGGFSAAARELGRPKSSISRSVSRLEDALGARLLERTTRQMRVTEVGEIVRRHCVRMLEEAEAAELSVDRLSEAPRGVLRVSASLTVGQAILTPLAKKFSNLYPEVNLRLMLTNRRVHLIEEGFDVAIRIGALEDSSLVARKLGVSNLGLYASKSYLESRGRPRRPQDLAKHDCMAMLEAEQVAKWTLLRGKESSVFEFSPRMVVNDFVALRAIAADGAGIAALPTYLSNDVRLERVLPKWKLAPVQLSALFASHRGATPKVRAFLDFLASEVPARLQEK